MDEPTRRPTLPEFLRHCEDELDFLGRDYGFARSATPTANPYGVSLSKGAFGIDVYGLSYGEAAACDLRWGVDHIPLGYLMPTVEPGRSRRARKGPGQLAQVSKIARDLKLHASDFLDGDLHRFGVALARQQRFLQRMASWSFTEADRLEQLRQGAFAEAGHAAKRADWAGVVRLLEPYADALSLRQQRLLEQARVGLHGKSS